MRERRPGWAVCRAAIALVALYALTLRALLGSVAFSATLDPTHVLCAPDAQSGDGPSKPQNTHVHLPCCMVGSVFDAAAPPVPPSLVIVWPARQKTVVWRPEADVSPRAPPGVSANARAPPEV